MKTRFDPCFDASCRTLCHHLHPFPRHYRPFACPSRRSKSMCWSSGKILWQRLNLRFDTSRYIVPRRTLPTIFTRILIGLLHAKALAAIAAEIDPQIAIVSNEKRMKSIREIVHIQSHNMDDQFEGSDYQGDYYGIKSRTHVHPHLHKHPGTYHACTHSCMYVSSRMSTHSSIIPLGQRLLFRAPPEALDGLNRQSCTIRACDV